MTVSPMEFLEAVYLSEELPLTVRMRAAIELLPFRHPKQSVVAIGHFDGKTFAEALERCIERSATAHNGQPMLNGPTAPLPREELVKPMARYRRF
jgi:hypothetical protein